MQPNGGIGAGLTDIELGELHSLLHNHVYCGPDEVVYGDDGITYRLILEKVTNEAKARKLWWAR